jgi:hypothetical protein
MQLRRVIPLAAVIREMLPDVAIRTTPNLRGVLDLDGSFRFCCGPSPADQTCQPICESVLGSITLFERLNVFGE